MHHVDMCTHSMFVFVYVDVILYVKYVSINASRNAK